MVLCNRQLKQPAASRLSGASYDPRKLFLIHCGVSLGATLLVTLANFGLNRMIANTGGLSGITLRSILITVQNALQLIVSLLLPFWEIGIFYAAIRLAREQSATPDHLTRGFHRIGPVLLLNLLRGLLVGLLVIPCSQVSVMLISVTPLYASMEEALMPLVEQMNATGEIPIVDEATMNVMLQAMLPAFVLSAVLWLGLSIPVMYRLKMADYLVIDDPKTGPFRAMLTSFRMTRRQLWRLIKLDLSFWWFYGAQLLLSAVTYADLVLPSLGISLPLPQDVTALMLYGVYMLGTLALTWGYGPYVQTTYAVLYDELKAQIQVPSIEE